jgi:hypothetical protein
VPKAVRKMIQENRTATDLESEADIWQVAEVLRGSLDGAKSREARVTAPRVPPPFEPKDNEC